MINLGSNPKSLPARGKPPHKAYNLVNNGPQCAHVEVFNRDGKSWA